MTMKNPGRGSGLGNAAGGAARKGLTELARVKFIMLLSK